MIGFNNLGNMGWIGNQMFQYASLHGIANNRGFEFCIPPNDGSRRHDYSLFKYFKMSNCKNVQYIDAQTYLTNMFDNYYTCGFEFNEQLFNFCPDNVNINAFLQTEKYFVHIKEKILEDFSFKKEYELPYEKYTSLHVRRGDYLSYPDKHPICEKDYYNKALEIVGKDLPIVVSSDDIKWCKNNISADYYSENNAIHDLFIMSKAQNNIIANSSFSWWGAWININDSKIVVAPKKWFGREYAHLDTLTLIPDTWILA